MESHLLDDYKLSAHIDWIELRVTFDKNSQFRYVQEAIDSLTDLGKLHIKPCGSNKNSTNTFDIRVQDPVPHALSAALKLLSTGFAKVITEQLTGIEIALDATPKTNSNLALLNLPEVAFALVRNLAHRHSLQPDIITYPGGFYNVTSRLLAVEDLARGFTLRTGRKGSRKRHRSYVKTRDRIMGDTGILVSPCARIEITLLANEVPVSTLKELTTYRFESLVEHFRQLKVAPLPAGATAAERMAHEDLSEGHHPLGTIASTRSRAHKKRGSLAGTVRNVSANERIAAALRTLTRHVANSVKKPTLERVVLPAPAVKISVLSEGDGVIATPLITPCAPCLTTSPNYVPSTNNPGWGAW